MKKYSCSWFSMRQGKGKIVDWLSEQADVVIRFQEVITQATLL